MTVPITISAAAAVTGAARQPSDPAQITGLGDDVDLPPIPVHCIASDHPDMLRPPKGTRYLDKTSKLALAVARKLTDGRDDLGDPTRTGVVVATSGSLRSSAEFYRETVVHDEPHLVSAKQFPTTVLNCAASQVAIHRGFTGTNATIMGENNASTAALRFALTAIASGHIDRAVVIGVDEMSAQRAWMRYRAGCYGTRAGLGEGAAAVLVERGNETVHDATPVLASIMRTHHTADGTVDHASLRDAVSRAIKRAGIDSDRISHLFTTCSLRDDLADIELAALDGLFNLDRVRVCRLSPESGDIASANGLLQLAAAHAVRDLEYGVITSLESDGTAAAAVIGGAR